MIPNIHLCACVPMYLCKGTRIEVLVFNGFLPLFSDYSAHAVTVRQAGGPCHEICINMYCCISNTHDFPKKQEGPWPGRQQEG